RRRSLKGLDPLFRREYVAAEDYDLWSRMLRQGLRFHNLPEPVLRYRAHEPGERPLFMKRQVASADRIRNQWLAWQGIRPSRDESALQRAAGRAEWPAGNRFLGP